MPKHMEQAKKMTAENNARVLDAHDDEWLRRSVEGPYAASVEAQVRFEKWRVELRKLRDHYSHGFAQKVIRRRNPS